MKKCTFILLLLGIVMPFSAQTTRTFTNIIGNFSSDATEQYLIHPSSASKLEIIITITSMPAGDECCSGITYDDGTIHETYGYSYNSNFTLNVPIIFYSETNDVSIGLFARNGVFPTFVCSYKILTYPFSSNGYLGIGTNDPLNGLHVYKSSDFYGGSIRFGHSGSYDGIMSFGLNSQTTRDALKFSYLPHNTTTGLFDIMTLDINGNVGIGTTTPSVKLEVNGDICLPNTSGKKCIYTWGPTDNNWRIGMNTVSGFTRALTTSHVQYITYSSGTGQGFAVGVNGGLSSFEIQGSNHQAYFRGSVGIGTPTPSSKLSIEGSSASDLGLSIYNSVYGNNQGNLLLFKAGTTYAVTDQRNAGVLESYNDLILSAAVGTGVTAPSIKFQTGRTGTVGNTRMIIDNTGNVGIGTTPDRSLVVNGQIGVYGGNMGLVFKNTASSNKTYDISSNNNDLYFNETGVSTSLVIKSGGNVLIGKTAQTNLTYKLEVEGTIRAKEIKVNTTGADFVFSPTYKLLSIQEVESYIKQYQHLPDVAPASDMQENGMSVSEMQTKLLQKVEELTLYMIKQQQQIEELKNKLETLETKKK